MNFPNNCLSFFCLAYFSTFLSTYPVTYPSGYEGNLIPGASDDDNDGLTLAQERTQGTSDSIDDTDNDGLDDLRESVWNPSRDNQFCDTSTPKNCTYPEPTKKDLYVEIDWLDNGTDNYKPSSTQLGLVAAKYAALDINFHADTGQYGGGNVIYSSEAPTTLPPGFTPGDFYHHKYGNGILELPNFNASNRYKIWHYMISGYNFDNGTTGATDSSGVSEGGGDDAFISYGLLASTRSGSTLDNAIAGSIVHELGHNLCLTNTDVTATYTGQHSSCVFDGVDNYSASSNYHSAMNYNLQFTNMYSYSDGTNGSGDHDDISAIMTGFDDFTWHDDDSGVGGSS